MDNNLATYVLKRLAATVGIVLGLIAILFLLQHISNVNPVRASLGPGATSEAVAAQTKRLGLDLPLWDQFLHYVGHLSTGNLGASYTSHKPVRSLLSTAFPATLELALLSLVLALVLAAILGVTSALETRGSGVIRLVMLASGSTPSFLIAIFGLVVLYKDLGVVPASGQTSAGIGAGSTGGMAVLASLSRGDLSGFGDALWHLLLPGLCIALAPAISIGRMLRSSLVAGLGSDWARTARSKGLRERTVLVRHALRNSLGPTLTMAGLQLAVMLAGVVVIEQIFSWPGVGFAMSQGIPNSDLPVIVGVTLVLGVSYVVINLIVDVLQVVIDPRQRL